MAKSHRDSAVTQQRRIEQAEAYIASQKSDPFARNRVYTHMRSGICGFTENGSDAFYSADEVRTEHGIVYTNIKQP
jgi:hypothetical protein